MARFRNCVLLATVWCLVAQAVTPAAAGAPAAAEDPRIEPGEYALELLITEEGGRKLGTPEKHIHQAVVSVNDDVLIVSVQLAAGPGQVLPGLITKSGKLKFGRTIVREEKNVLTFETIHYSGEKAEGGGAGEYLEFADLEAPARRGTWTLRKN